MTEATARGPAGTARGSAREITTRRLQSLRAILMQSDDALRARLPEYFLVYYKHLRILRNPARIEHLFQKGREMFAYLDAEGKDVLDLGAGFGIEALLVAIYGARRVLATEIDRDMVAVGDYLARAVDPPVDHFESRYGDGIGMELPSASFDGVMANCVISHVRDLDGFLREANRLLRPGGIFFLSDENNSLYLPARGRRRRGWHDMEREPNGPYFVARRALIGEHFPALAENQLLEAARRTRGLVGGDVIAGTRELLETGTVRRRAEFPYRDPRDGQYPERELNPFWMMARFREAGLQPELLPAFFSRGIEVHPRQWVKDVLRFFCTRWPVLSVYVWPIMRIRGRKVR
ncbi:MAG TPA: class I SAM-dependent methyltransferase [Candidatus Limnocylindrales bacterium]|nr:class I SAM-dependent methyltransferase [Candidatus Limnocylindrales bacterium]